MDERARRTLALERRIGRLLIALTYVSVGLLVVGVVLMVTGGTSPLSGGPGLDLAKLPETIAALDPAAFLWLGILTVIATPVSQVALAGVAYARNGDRTMVGIALAILAIMAVGVVTAAAGTV